MTTSNTTTADNFDWTSFYNEVSENLKVAQKEEEEMVVAEEKKYKTCWKCGGVGHLDGYRHVSNGICFQCGGTGKLLK